MVDGTTPQEVHAGANASSVEWVSDPWPRELRFLSHPLYLLDNSSPLVTKGSPHPEEAASSNLVAARADDPDAGVTAVADAGPG